VIIYKVVVFRKEDKPDEQFVSQFFAHEYDLAAPFPVTLSTSAVSILKSQKSYEVFVYCLNLDVLKAFISGMMNGVEIYRDWDAYKLTGGEKIITLDEPVKSKSVKVVK